MPQTKNQPMTHAEDELRAALRASKMINGDRLDDTADRSSEAKLPRVVIDMKVPLPVILGVVLALAGGGISMYYKVNSVADSLIDIKAAMTFEASSRAQMMTELTNTKSELGLVRYRLDKLEGAHPK